MFICCNLILNQKSKKKKLFHDININHRTIIIIIIIIIILIKKQLPLNSDMFIKKVFTCAFVSVCLCVAWQKKERENKKI